LLQTTLIHTVARFEKWLELLKEIAPRLTRVAVMFNPQTAPYVEYYLKPLETAASKIAVKAFAAPVRSETDIEAVVAGLGGDPGGYRHDRHFHGGPSENSYRANSTAQGCTIS
jgi:hypothetical protein